MKKIIFIFLLIGIFMVTGCPAQPGKLPPQPDDPPEQPEDPQPEIPFYSISGTVTCNVPGGFLSGANIKLKHNNEPVGNTITGGDGTYSFSDVPDGIYTIEVSKEGYNNETIPAFTVSGADVTGKDLQLTKIVTVHTWPTTGAAADELLFHAIQGISSRTGPSVYMTGYNYYLLWLDELRAQHNFITVPVNSLWQLAAMYKDHFAGYVLYNSPDTEAMNYAATIAGVLDALPVSAALESNAIALGLDKLDDASNYTGIQQVINKYSASLNKDVFLHQEPGNKCLRDYGIKQKCIITYPGSTGLNFIYDFLNPNAVQLGWHDDEVSGVKEASQKQIVTIASNYANNMSFFSCFAGQDFTQKEPVDKNLKAESGKHYIAFAYSDGDNVQWIINGGTTDITRFGHEKSAAVPIGWSLAPTLSYFAPVCMDYTYRTAAPTDNIIAGVSGYGYIHPSEYYKAGKMQDLVEFGRLTAESMKKSDMYYTEILDEHVTYSGTNAVPTSVLDAFTMYDQIKGVLFKCGSRYVGNGKGFIKWSNNKPVVAIRESLWSTAANGKVLSIAERDTEIFRMAYRITQYGKDPAKIDGYTLINVHAWSHDYESITRLADWLTRMDDNIVIVTPDTLMRLINENVPKTDAQPTKNFDGFTYSNYPTVIVKGGTGGGRIASGNTATITAAVPAGMEFSHWTITPNVVFTAGNIFGSTASFTVPDGLLPSGISGLLATAAGAVTAVANFIPSEPTPAPIAGFAWIKRGTFMMGSPESEPGRATVEIQHLVTLTEGFYMSKYPVTQEQYDNLDMGLSVAGCFPVVNVSWEQGIKFCNKLSIKDGLSPAYIIKGSTNPDIWGTFTPNDVSIAADANGYRLPTEAQWEYTCRAGTTTAYNVGTTITTDDANFNNSTRTPVDKFPPNAWGLHDKHGNVWEFVWDLYGNNNSYNTGAKTDPMGDTDGTVHILRGGSYDNVAYSVRSATRLGYNPPGANIGFRIIRKE